MFPDLGRPGETEGRGDGGALTRSSSFFSSFFFPLEEEGLAGGAGSEGAAAEAPPLGFSGGDMAGLLADSFADGAAAAS